MRIGYYSILCYVRGGAYLLISKPFIWLSLLSKNDFYLDSILGERQPELLVGNLAE